MSEHTALSAITALSEHTALSEQTALSPKTALGSNTAEITHLFNQKFSVSQKTTVQGGADDPFYQANGGANSIIFFKEDFASSALHEISHWCLAGVERRKFDDYGYWYQPVRCEIEQRKFEQMEIQPQALEWILSVAMAIPFRVSADNLDLPDYDMSGFAQKVRSQVFTFIKTGLPPRAKLFADALADVPARAGVDYTQQIHYRRLPVR